MKHVQNYIFAGIITVLMFISAFIFVDKLHERQTIDLASLRTELSLSLADQELESEIQSTIPCDSAGLKNDALLQLGTRISALESQNGWEDAYVQQLKEEYTILLIRSYIAATKHNALCDDQLTILVAFVQHKDCSECEAAWHELWGYEQEVTNTKAFIFDVGIQLSSLQRLEDVFGVDGSVPAIYYNSRPVTLDELRELRAGDLEAQNERGLDTETSYR